jgi:diguanylate cyclase (GGDEF)-like protein/PAS domain S-box-containing protein
MSPPSTNAISVARPRDHVRYVGRLLLLAAAYYLSARIGMSTGFLRGNVAAIWPPAGVALGTMILYGPRVWPGVALGALLVNGTGGSVPLLAACGMAVGNTLEAVVGAQLVGFLHFQLSLSRVRDVVALFSAAALSTLVGAVVGVSSLWAGGVITSHVLLQTGRVWWMGDGLADLVLAPAILLGLGAARRPLTSARRVEGTLLLAAVVATTGYAFYGSGYPYVVLPVVAWAALRFGPKGAAAAVLAVSAIAVPATAAGHGHFAAPANVDALVVLATFIAIVAITAFVLAAVVAERDDMQTALRAANTDLEGEVFARIAELHATENRFEALVDGIPDFAIYMLDPDGRVLSWNAGAERLMGYTADEIIGHTLDRLHRPEDVDAGKSALALERARTVGRAEEEAWRVRADGTMFWARVVITPLIRDGALIGFAKVTHDVTAPRQAQAELQQVATELADAQRAAHIGSFRVDVLGATISYWSEELFRILGLDPATHTPSFGGLIERLHPHDRPHVEALVGAAFGTGGSFEVEARIVRGDGDVRVVATSAHVANDSDGQPRYVVGVCQDITTRKATEDALTHLAGHDGLTGLPNRTLVLDRLTVALSRRDRVPGETAVFFVDVDRFKRLNDRFGHAAGDQMLVEIAGRLTAAVRPEDTVGRLGGDEFVIICEGLDQSGIALLAPRLMNMLSRPIVVDGEEVTPTASIGIAVSEASVDTEETASSLLRDADTAMYQAKDRGRARYEIFDAAMRAAVEARLETESALRRALDGDEIVTYFQPVVDLATGAPVGVEALARWQHPTRGLLLPDQFIPLAEESGLVLPLGRAVLMRACEEVARWRRLAPELATLEVAVNLSARQLLDPGLRAAVEDALAGSGLSPNALCLEITETVLLDDADLAASLLNDLKSMGVQIALDDFGTGFSSLTYLKRLPVDILKIDRSFVMDLGTARDAAIVSGVIDFADAFGMITVAEGVETIEHARELRNLGCIRAQGYLWSGAVPADDALAFIRASLNPVHVRAPHVSPTAVAS